MPLGQDPLGLVNSTLQTNRQARQNAPSNRPFTDALRFRMEQERQTANLQQLEAQQAAMTKNQQRQDLKMAFEMVKAGVPSAAVFDAVNVPNSHHKMLKFVEKQARDAQGDAAVTRMGEQATEIASKPRNDQSDARLGSLKQALSNASRGFVPETNPAAQQMGNIEQAQVVQGQDAAADLAKRDLDVRDANRKSAFNARQPGSTMERLWAEKARNGGHLPPDKMKYLMNGLIKMGFMEFTNAKGETERHYVDVSDIRNTRQGKMIDSLRGRDLAIGLIDDLLVNIDDPYKAGTSGGVVAAAANFLGIAGDFGRVLSPEEDEAIAGEIIGTLQAIVHADGAAGRHEGATQEFLDEVNSAKGAAEAAHKALSYGLVSQLRGDPGGRFSIRAVEDMGEFTDIYSGDRVKIRAKLEKTKKIIQGYKDATESSLGLQVPSYRKEIAPATENRPRPGAAPPASPSLKPGDELVPGSGVIIKSIEPSVGG